MNALDQHNNTGGSSARPEPPVRPGLLLAIIGLLAVAGLAGLGIYFKQHSAKSLASEPAPTDLPGAEESSTTAATATQAEARRRESTIVAVAAKAPRPPVAVP